jgi:gas vesicle protein
MATKKLTGLAFLAVGAGIGAAVALLYAPRAGKHTRRRIRNSANRAVNEITEIRDNLRTSMSEWVDETSETIASSIAAGRETLKDGTNNLRSTLGMVRERMEDGRSRVEEYVRSVGR